jgi:DNA (cytosine-5)-methyltransferase 1
MNYYNEYDKHPAAWLRELAMDKQIPDGIVDERSIVDVKADELKQYKQCHFFAGIGGWAYALRLAGWPDDKPVWSASLPCQPFSTAGKQKGDKDDRHLWPVFYELVKANRPFTIFGEQVPNAIKLGWFDRVFNDLEAEGYTCGAVVLPACSIGAPHIRQRIFWVAQSKEQGLQGCYSIRQEVRNKEGKIELRCNGGDSGMAHPNGFRLGRRGDGCGESEGTLPEVETTRPCGLGDSRVAYTRMLGQTKRQEQAEGREQYCQDSRLGNTELHGCNGVEKLGGAQEEGRLLQPERPSPWSDYIFIPCADGKARRIKPGIMPLVDGVPRGVVQSGDIGEQEVENTGEARAMRIKGYGNAIVPELAAVFIKAFLEDNAA